ncbi:MAG: MFS transporter [Chloroflexi bacterium]|nr:MFS transporter [Chloroflexota bacterium]
MALPPEFDQPLSRSLGGVYRRLDGVVSRGQDRLFRIMWFAVPPQSVARNLDFQSLMASRFLSDLALQALFFAALIASARGGGTGLEAAAISVAFLLPGVFLGPFGGAVADAMPKRIALAGAYLTMGLLALVIPLASGTGFVNMLLVIFLVRVLHQVSQPAESSAAPLVANEAELASANSFLSLASSAGEVTGKALLAPLVVRFWGLTPVTVTAGLLFVFSALRVINFRPPHASEAHGAPREPFRLFGFREALRWLLREPGAFWMLMLAAMASTIGVVLGTLGPLYVKDVLHIDPANTFYVFAPASIGVVMGLAAAPLAIRMLGERAVAVFGFVTVAIGLVMIGQIGWTLNLFRWVLVFNIPRVPPSVEMAGAISLFVGLGMTLAAAATQTYIGRYVPVYIHGRVFALLGTLKDGLAMPQLIIMGAIASRLGVGTVLTLAPAMLLLVAFGIAQASKSWRRPNRPEGAVPSEGRPDA